jgi:hypothetical protein
MQKHPENPSVLHETEVSEYPQGESHNPAISRGKSQVSGHCDAKSGALPADPDFAELAAAWLQLSNAQRSAIQKIIRAV